MCTPTQRFEQLQRVVEPGGGEPLGEVVGPGRLDLIALLHDPTTPRGAVHEFGSLMGRVVRQCPPSLLGEAVHRPLHALAGQAHLPGHVHPGELDGTTHLPPGTRKPKGCLKRSLAVRNSPWRRNLSRMRVVRACPAGVWVRVMGCRGAI